jgi:hypothetical protein
LRIEFGAKKSKGISPALLLWLFEIAGVFVCRDVVAGRVINADQGIM